MSLDVDPRDLFPKPPGPQALIGAASPLWGFFATAAAGGLAFWCMTRLMRPQNLEAMFATAEAGPNLMADAADAAVDMAPEMAPPEPMTQAVMTPDLPDLPEAPVGGEAAPISPVLEVPGGVMAEPADVAAPGEPRSVKPRSKPPANEEPKPL